MCVSLDTEHLKHISWCLRYSEFQGSLCERVLPKDGHDMLLGLSTHLMLKISRTASSSFLEDISYCKGDNGAIFCYYYHPRRTLWRSRLRHCVISRKVASSIPDGPRAATASNRIEYQEYFLGGKGGRCVGLTSLPHGWYVARSVDWLLG